MGLNLKCFEINCTTALYTLYFTVYVQNLSLKLVQEAGTPYQYQDTLQCVHINEIFGL